MCGLHVAHVSPGSDMGPMHAAREPAAATVERVPVKPSRAAELLDLSATRSRSILSKVESPR
jgi:hypothetical protein